MQIKELEKRRRKNVKQHFTCMAAQFWLQMSCHASKTSFLNPVPGSKIMGRRQSDLICGGLVKHHILRKIEPNSR